MNRFRRRCVAFVVRFAESVGWLTYVDQAVVEVVISSCRSEARGDVGVTEDELLASLAKLRSTSDLAPRSGFYDRVRTRIEGQERSSMWSMFAEIAFTRRLIQRHPNSAGRSRHVFVDHGERSVGGRAGCDSSATDTILSTDRNEASTAASRDAVLLNLASYHE